jgi:hypothetical protein
VSLRPSILWGAIVALLKQEFKLKKSEIYSFQKGFMSFPMINFIIFIQNKLNPVSTHFKQGPQKGAIQATSRFYWFHIDLGRWEGFGTPSIAYLRTLDTNQRIAGSALENSIVTARLKLRCATKCAT